MGRLVIVGNEKGGCGKTTVAVHIAAAAACARRDVLLVDADPGQQSSARWCSRRREAHPNAPPVRCISLTAARIWGELEDLRTRYEVVVVDTGAEDSPQLRAAITVADVLVVPMQTDAFDLWSLAAVEQLYHKGAEINRNLGVVVVPNRIPFQVGPEAAAAAVVAWMKETVPRLPRSRLVPLIGRSAYGVAAGAGLSVAEIGSRGRKAASEIAQLCKEVHG